MLENPRKRGSETEIKQVQSNIATEGDGGETRVTNPAPLLSHPLVTAAVTQPSALMASGYSSCVCLFLLNNNTNYFINSVQTAAGQKGASPSWMWLTYLLDKLQTTKPVETQSI